jgi:hypothetical protein
VTFLFKFVSVPVSFLDRFPFIRSGLPILTGFGAAIKPLRAIRDGSQIKSARCTFPQFVQPAYPAFHASRFGWPPAMSMPECGVQCLLSSMPGLSHSSRQSVHSGPPDRTQSTPAQESQADQILRGLEEDFLHFYTFRDHFAQTFNLLAQTF